MQKKACDHCRKRYNRRYGDVWTQWMIEYSEDVIVMRHGLMGKNLIPLNPQIQTDKPQIWQLVSSITIWYIWKARCLKVFQNVTERPTQIISGIWIEIVHNLRGLLDSIKGNTHQVELKRLEFHAI